MAGKKRIELIDVAKALTIFTVILGHTAGNLDTPTYRIIIYAFHMPLFFILAGMSMKVKPVLSWKDGKKFLYKIILAIIVPYFVWGMIFSQSTYDVSIPNLLYGSWEGLVQMNTLTSLWFLPCFFVAKLIAQAVISLISALRIPKVSLACGISAVILYIVGMIVPHPEIGCFFCSDAALTAAAFILLGVALKRSILILAQQKNYVLAICLAGSLIMFVIGTFARLDKLGLSLMCNAQYVHPFWFAWNALSGSMVIMSISMIIERISRESPFPFSVKAITFIGQHTMGIFIIHKQFLANLVMPFLNNYLSGHLPVTVIALIGAVIMLPVSCGICVIIEKFIPQMLGQFSEPAS